MNSEKEASMFYHYSQNNSGGSFDFNEARGITHHVVIEASSPQEADARAEDVGLYWDGCETANDCPCCGDRWSPAHDSDGAEYPHVYSEKLGEHECLFQWMPDGKEIAVHYKDGTVGWYGANAQ